MKLLKICLFYRHNSSTAQLCSAVKNQGEAAKQF